MKWTRFLALALGVVCALAMIMVGAALGQDSGTPGAESFALVQQLGRPRPQGIQYDPNFDRFVRVDPGGRLVLVDGATFAVTHVLYEEGSYSTYTFSHDGRWLALGIDRRVELWDTRTGALAASTTPEEALSIQDPLQFAPDDSLLMINALVPAPAALRRSENDTSNLPYLWDLPAARDEADPSLPGSYTLYAFYDYRYGFVLGPDRTAITALPQRFQVMDLTTNYPILAEIASSRNERDPLYIWRSLRDDTLYVLPQGSNNLFQVDGGTTFEIPLGYDLFASRLEELGGLQVSKTAQILGAPRSRADNSLLRLLLGDTYRAEWQYHPLTVMLLDFLDPITQGQDQAGLLLYIFDDQAGRGVIEFLRPPDVLDMALHPDGTRLLVRRASGAQPVEVYDLATGVLELTVYPTISDPDGRQVLAYNRTGDVIVCDFQRFDARTGAVLAENPHYVYGFEGYTFTQDSTGIVTRSGSNWWLWNLDDGAVVRRATVNLRGEIVAASPDAMRFLTTLGTGQGTIMEVTNIATSERRSVTIPALPQRPILDIIPSPDWEHFLVVYGSALYGPYFPGNEIAIYNLYTGQRWFYAGDDLPPPDARQYSWLDNRTAYITGAVYESGPQPERVYGLDYHASGLPQCLVDTFPDDWPRWVDVWERFSARLRGDTLNRLAMKLCKPDTVDAVEAVFFPTPTATRPPVSPTPPFIAGVPQCLTTYFAGDARDYAAIWREMTAGKTPEEIADLEELLCEGLAETAPLPGDEVTGEAVVDTTQVLTIDVITGERSFGGYIPFREQTPPRSLDLVLAEFERIYRYRPQNAQLSPDGTLLAVHDYSGFIQVYRLLKPYDAMVTDATATAAPQAEEELPQIAMLPTATQPFDPAGGPRPTLTPTVTPTAPPRPVQPVEQADRGTVEELCPAQTLYSIETPPPDYAATGDLLVRIHGSPVVWRLDMSTGHLRPDETIPKCGMEVGCDYSFDRNWILWGENDDLFFSRPDGSAAHTLFYAGAWPVEFQGIDWIDAHTLEYAYQKYYLDRSPEPLIVHVRLDPVTGTVSEPFIPPDPVRINDLDTEIVAAQPGSGVLALARTAFNTGWTTGYKYYILNQETGTADYFARLADYGNDFAGIEWHPLGKALYYRYPGADEWMIYDVATGTHRVLGDLPGGEWSRDGRYRADWFMLSPDELQARIKAGQPLPKLSIWDSDTGLIRRYCVPQTGEYPVSAPPTWSPDGRYLVFSITLPDEAGYEVAYPRTLVLDTVTGSVTELTFLVETIEAWIEGGNHESR